MAASEPAVLKDLLPNFDSTREDLLLLLNHVILPPNLPQREDKQPEHIGYLLLQLTKQAASVFACSLPQEQQGKWNPVSRMLEQLSLIQHESMLDKARLDQCLYEMQPNDILALHIREQNAGLVVHRRGASDIVFECFEVSPSNEAVIKTSGRLRRKFPGLAVSCPADLLAEPEFRAEFVSSLCRLDSEFIELTTPSTRKAGSVVRETRDTVSPIMITQYLFNVLLALGCQEDVTPLLKHTRDDVVWSDALLPWRRSPAWLVLKIALQRSLIIAFGSKSGQTQYKEFMIFVNSCLLNKSLHADFTGDMLALINAKLARRVFKVGDLSSTLAQSSAETMTGVTRARLESQWSYSQQMCTRRLRVLPLADKDTAVSLALTESRGYLAEVLQWKPKSSDNPGFNPSQQSRLGQDAQLLPLCVEMSQQRDLTPDQPDIEHWVKHHLPTWTGSRPPSVEDCTSLSDMITLYASSGLATTKGCPRSRSLALLTLLELWVSLDKLTIKRHPSLQNYSPEVPANICEPLLLPNRDQMKRLQQVELYLRKRHAMANPSLPHILSDPKEGCFAARFFDNSSELKLLQVRILEDAQARKARKTQEWEDSKDTYNSLKEQANELEHEVAYNEDGEAYHPKRGCEKCTMNWRSRNVPISLDEWSLPTESVQQKAAIFELACPADFAAWRDSTWLLVQDLGRPGKTERGVTKYDSVLEYSQLRKFAVSPHRHSRLTLASYTKSFLVSHYKPMNFPTPLSSVCRNNALQFRLWDNTDAWVADQNQPPSFKSYCVYQIPPGPYENLQWALTTTTHTSNSVMARQSECHSLLELEEFRSFGSLRSGDRLQWLNVLRELGCSNLNWNTAAVHSLVRQTAWEAGTGGIDDLRRAHDHFADESFCAQLLCMLGNLLERIRANWKEQDSMQTVVVLTLRLLSLATSRTIVDQTLSLLRRVRLATRHWISELRSRAKEASNEEDNDGQRISRFLLGAALCCHATFDVDDEHAAGLCSSDDDVTTFVQAQMAIYDNNSGNEDLLDDATRQRLSRASVIAHAYTTRLQQSILSNSIGLDRAIQKLWHGASLSAQWSVVKSADDWINTVTQGTGGAASLEVHYNIRTGQLLVAGRPLGTVPGKFANTALFRRLFRCASLRAVTSDMPGMMYALSTAFNGHEVHLGWIDDDIRIRLRASGQELEVVPHMVFHTDLPKHFVVDYIHLLHLRTGEIEFRPLDKLWQKLDSNPRLLFNSISKSTMLLRQKRLIDPSSNLGKAIMNIFSVLDEPCNIHCTVDGDGIIEIRLHRYNLHFFANPSGQLESLEFNAVVDLNQNIGTLHGLKNMLVLRDHGNHVEAPPQSVLIPLGVVTIVRDKKHVAVSVDNLSAEHQKYFYFNVDRYLKKLRSPQDLLASLYKAYLHAVTSGLLPDVLTMRTGTEEALATLREAAMFSPNAHSDEILHVLNAIAELTPHRAYYPQHMKVMQQITWKTQLTWSAQHDEFLPAAMAILEYSAKFTALSYSASVTTTLRSRGDSALHHRALQRTACFRGPENGAKASKLGDDADYLALSRDQHSTTNRAQAAYEIAALIKEWPTRLHTQASLTSLLNGWDVISGYNLPFAESSFESLLQLPLRQHWGSLYDLCRNSTRAQSKFYLMFLFATFAFGDGGKDGVTLRTLLAFVFNPVFRTLPPPPTHTSYTLSKGTFVQNDRLRSTIARFTNEAYANRILPPSHYTKRQKKQWRDCNLANRLAERTRTLERELSNAVRCISQQWPESELTSIEISAYLSPNHFLPACQLLFDEWHKNRVLMDHITQVQLQLSRMYCSTTPRLLPPPLTQPLYTFCTPVQIPGLSEALALQHTSAEKQTLVPPAMRAFATPGASSFVSKEVEVMVSGLRADSNSRRQNYGKLLARSVKALKSQSTLSTSPGTLPSIRDFQDHVEQTRLHLNTTFVAIMGKLSPKTAAEEMLEKADLWPRATPQLLLSFLSAQQIAHLSQSWKAVLVGFAESLALHQRAERLFGLAGQEEPAALIKELAHPGREGWSASDHPSWLLIEIENNITIRKTQARVAFEMVNPRSGSNTVLQLSMGEGKSTVIIPMVVAALADGSQLVRVVVLKPLLRQTGQLLSNRLGGLLNQRTYFTSFSRQTSLSDAVLDSYQSIYEECMAGRGVMLALPENILSFRLMQREKMASNPRLGAKLLTTERWLARNSRDVLDESDQLLDARFQLVYTTGEQQMLDGQPDRWLIAQVLLQRVNIHAARLALASPRELEVDRMGNRFPFLAFLHPESGARLVALLVQDVLDGNLGVSFDYYPQSTKDAISEYIGNRSVSVETSELVESVCFQDQHGQTIWHLRGLLAHGVLLFALQKKRWLVEYGLDPSRCLMAVPYRAKGVPSPSAEFDHPDVAVLLTCLSYYYTGLTFEQIKHCFTILLKDANASDEYLKWWDAADGIPLHLRSLDAVNLEDDKLCREVLFPHLQFNQAAANFFLARHVFPKEGKEFAKKISTSAWDLPLSKGGLTTGFSGTNDNRFVLPLSIKQDDLPELEHTSAMVINLLLRPENRTYHCAMDAQGKKLSVAGLLSFIHHKDNKVQVLIDVGAQMMDNNRSVAFTWLELVPAAEAVLYFDEADEAIVADRHDIANPLKISPFRNRLDKCLIYIDEAHSRGIDLPIPANARAAVTLGPRLVKDRLVQACLRMRKLGNGQSIQFFAPFEAHQSILDTTEATNGGNFTSAHVVYWSMVQTCEAMEIAQPLRLMQGLEFLRRERICDKYFPDESATTELLQQPGAVQTFWDRLQEDESKTLEQMYGTTDKTMSTFTRLLRRHSSEHMMLQLVDEFDSMERSALKDAALDEEQEREVAHEVERERQVQRPPAFKPAVHVSAPGALEFVRTGSTTPGAKSQVSQAFQVFQRTAAAGTLVSQNIKPKTFRLFVTADYTNSVQGQTSAPLDVNMLRTVNWVLSSLTHDQLLIISPHEANELMPLIRGSTVAKLHVFAPRITKTMVSFDSMDFYTICKRSNTRKASQEMIRNLNIFAGALYSNSLAEYEALCDFLGVVTPARLSNTQSEVAIASDGFAPPESRMQLSWPLDCPFTKSPLPLLKSIFSLRCRGQDFGHTHMGCLVNGRAVRQNIFSQGQEQQVDVDTLAEGMIAMELS